mmetsp:Transcript_131/g.219  ORF Transcript_131/g.219 Transcript_131/m.219 type:complete len:349 (+) Transcript_131:479-1525(+)
MRCNDEGPPSPSYAVTQLGCHYPARGPASSDGEREPGVMRARPPRRALRAPLCSPGAAELSELLEGRAKVGGQLCLVRGVDLEVPPEGRVPREYQVGHEHHLVGLVVVRLVRLLVDKLAVARRRPQLRGSLRVEPGGGVVDERPIVLDHVGRVLVREGRGVLHPRPRVAGRGRVAPAVHVPSAQQRHDLGVVETHPAEDFVAHVAAQPLPPRHATLAVDGVAEPTLHVRAEVLFRRGQPAVGHATPVRFVLVVRPARSEGDGRAAGVLDPHVRREDPQVRVGHLREARLHRLQEGARHVQPRILRVGGLGGEAHAGTVGAAGAARRVVRAAAVPRQPDEDRSERAVVP